MNKELSRIYSDPTTGFSGINNLLRKAKEKKIKNVQQKDVQQFLKSELPYTLHKPVRKNFKKERVYVHQIDDQWQADIVEMIPYSSSNDGYKYILMVIDVFSKFAWAVPLMSKRPDEVKSSFMKIFALGRHPKRIQTDDGMEFFGKPMSDYFKKENINHFSTKTEIKAGIVERLNRTIKEKMWKYFSFINKYRWIDILDKLMFNYNNSYHRSIGMKPTEVNNHNEHQVWNNLYASSASIKTPTYETGDTVRITKYKRKLFDKGYIPNWTEELFIIHTVHKTSPSTYTVADLKGEILKGKFYEQEIQKVDGPVSFVIEEIVKERKHKGIKQFLVKWQGYPESYNSWVDEKDMQ